MASSAAILISAANATFIPAPAAGPFTAAITGCGIMRMRSIAPIPARRMGSNCFESRASLPLPIEARSPPAQKARPAPVSTTTRTASFFPMRSKARLRALANSLFSEFNFSGRFITKVATPLSMASSSTGPAAVAVGGSLIPSFGFWLKRFGIARSLDLADERGKLPEMDKTISLFLCMLGICRGQHVNLRAIQ